ncbi:MAG: hypothetical protein OXE52_04920, partial [Chloroflexi bacterium]|nr:hypothetical protein [Chloroflexota bacterium]
MSETEGMRRLRQIAPGLLVGPSADPVIAARAAKLIDAEIAKHKGLQFPNRSPIDVLRGSGAYSLIEPWIQPLG